MMPASVTIQGGNSRLFGILPDSLSPNFLGDKDRFRH
jgi:hypothetical protein